MPGDPVSAGPGYFGKVASHGDFVRRGLAPAFVASWDGWLQACLQHSRESFGVDWLATYLYSPLWRFALGADVCGGQAMAGVLMPSVDRVGRYFPLTLAAPIGGGEAPGPALFGRGADWFAALEQVAFGSLAPGFALAALDGALDALAREGRAPGCAAALAGQSMFWTADAPDGAAPLVCAGLPSRELFCAMLAERP